MFRLGADFQAGRRGDTYDARTGQWWLWAVLFFVLQFVVLSFAQLLTSYMAYAAMFGGLPDFAHPGAEFPAAVLGALFSWWCGGWANSSLDRGIPLRWPDLGSGGWTLTIVGVVGFLYLAYIVTFTLLGIDPKTYAPTAKGLNDLSSSAGLVEKTIADLVDEPWLFAIALPGIVFGAPLSEELIFRGALFSALRQSWAGKTGAVVLTAAVWALVHGSSAPWLFVSMIFLMGLVLGILLLRFGSLWVTIMVHAAWNGLTTLGIFGTIGGS
jgi:membrane protease YdiL (CAAX protease family)